MPNRRISSKLRKIFHYRSSSRRIVEPLLFLLTIVLFALICTHKVIEFNNSPLRIAKNFIYIEPLASFFRRTHNRDNIKIDWHDYKLMDKERTREGLGEGGRAVEEPESEASKRVFDENGYNGLISDKISVNRSIPDLRHGDCKKLRYLKELPTASVIIPFYNEHLSVLMRTVHSVINRSPPNLLKEIILVNDRSTKDFLYSDLKDYLNLNFDSRVRLFELPNRSGLIWARLAGARAATGDVLIFLDSHTEANINWLPPLLDPIAKNYRICTCPFIDVIEYNTFEYVIQDEGSRGIFDWNFNYRKMELKQGFQKRPTDLFQSPVMAGGLFAISTKFFWELGGYDTGLDIWGGEQYELSFKIHLCHGDMFDVPCSRVGHVYRGAMPFEDDRNGKDFVAVNYKRVAEVWMDDYKNYLYMRDPDRYSKADAGDLSYQLSIKRKLNCKPFSHFIENIVPDMLDFYPLVDPPAFASGVIQSLFDTGLCIDTYGKEEHADLALFSCADDLENPQRTQFFTLRHFRDIELKGTIFCLDQNDSGAITTSICHHQQGNQYFRYDLDSQQIFHGSLSRDECVEMDPTKGEGEAVFLAKCDENSMMQKWRFGRVNETAVRGWTKNGVTIVDKQEIELLEERGRK